MVKKGLKAWRSMPQARRQNLKSKGVDTRKEKVAFGRKLLRSRRQGTPGPTAKSVTGNGGSAARSFELASEAGTGGVAPRGLGLERTRKTTTRGGKVGVTRVGMTSGPAGVEQYRMVEAPTAAVAAKTPKANAKTMAKPKAKAKVTRPKAKRTPNVGKRPVTQRKAQMVVRRRRR
jgi:hypothetical protein